MPTSDRRTPPRPLAEWPLESRRHIRGVFTDIDDTLTTHGIIGPEARRALADLRAAGLRVVAITGRHVGWCEELLTAPGQDPLPVDAIVAENGALALQPLSQGGLRRLYQQDDATRQHNGLRMQQVAQRVLAEVPQARQSEDKGGRETDLAFDYNEKIHLPPAIVEQIVDLLAREGMQTSVSSIHIHGCFGQFDKWLGACWIVRTLWQEDLGVNLGQWVFSGDSGNDQAMFEHFEHSVGVANIRNWLDRLRFAPQYLTPSERGAGFAEMVHAILQAR